MVIARAGSHSESVFTLQIHSKKATEYRFIVDMALLMS